MRQSLSHLSYVSADGNLYLFQDRTLYRIRLEDGSSQPVKEGIDPQCFEVSDSQRTVAWMDEMLPDGSSNITVMNLDSGETRTISAGAGEKIKALGFINEDFIYGLARDQEILTDPSGSTLFSHVPGVHRKLQRGNPERLSGRRILCNRNYGG